MRGKLPIGKEELFRLGLGFARRPLARRFYLCSGFVGNVKEIERFRPVRLHGFDLVSGLHVSTQQRFRQRVFQQAFDRAAHGARSVLRIVPVLDDQAQGFRAQGQGDVLGLEAGDELVRLQLHDMFQIVPFQHAENGDFVKAVEEFRTELFARFLQDFSLMAA